MRNWWILEYHLLRYDDGVDDDDDVATAHHIQTPQLTNLSPLCLGFCLTKAAMIATEVRQPTIPRAILRRFTFYSIAKQSSHKVITWKRIALTKHWVLNRIAPPSSITIGLIMLYLLPRPWAAISDFRFTFRRGKLSFCAAKSMDDLSLAFRNLHKLHNSRSSVNYLDVAAWTCAWKVFSRSLFKLIFNQRANFWPGPVIAKITGWCKHWHWLMSHCEVARRLFERLLELVFWLIVIFLCYLGLQSLPTM